MTRRRILEAAMEAVQDGGFGLREIADRASVTVQTVYAHYGSKAGLLSAVVQEASAAEGLVAGLARVWKHRSARAALDEMVKATFDFWRRAWPLVSLMLTELRADQDFAAQVRGVNESRLADLVKICEELERSGDLRPGMKPAAAAALVFAMTSPYAYEDLVASGRLAYARALRTITDAVNAAVLRHRR